MTNSARSFDFLTTRNPGEPLTIEQRLFRRAQQGMFFAELGIYHNQEKRLIGHGCSVQHTGHAVDPKYRGAYSCRITWNLVADQDSFAYYLYTVAKEVQNSSCAASDVPAYDGSSESACPPPYSGGWE